MASRRPARRGRSRRRKPAASLGQKLLVGLSGAMLVLCAASITYGVFVRKSTDPSQVGQLRIEVLNGTGKPGLAHAAKRGLLRRGVDVINADNAPNFDYRESILIARKRGADVATLGKLLGCDNVVEQLREGTLEDATLILGADYRELSLDWELESGLLE